MVMPMKFCWVRTVPVPWQYEQVWGLVPSFCAGAVAGAAGFDAGEGDLAFTAESRVLKADLDLADDVLALRRASSAAGRRRCAASEEIAEDIAEISKSEPASAKAAEACVWVEIRVYAREAVLVIPGLLSASDRTSYASLISLNFSSAVLSPGF